MSYNDEELRKLKNVLNPESLLNLMFSANLATKGRRGSPDLGKPKDGRPADKKGEPKREADKDRPVKRLSVPPLLKLLASLEVPIDMVDPGVYLEVARKALAETLQAAKANKLVALTDSLEKAIAKCDKLIQKGPEEYTKKKKEKEIADFDLIQILKKPNFLEELEDHDISKIKNSEVREKIGSLLSKREAPSKTVKDRWENDYFAYYRNKYLKKD